MYNIVGNRFRGAAEQLAFNHLTDGDELTLVREPDNQYDSNAIKVMQGDLHLGYIPKTQNEELAAQMDADGATHRRAWWDGFHVSLSQQEKKEPVELDIDDEIPF